MKPADIVIFLDGILMIAMGVLGFVRKGSVPSLMAGVTIGVLLIATIFLAKTNPRVGRIAAAVIALLPLGQFGREFVKTHAIYPAGLICAAGLFTFAFLLASHFMATKAKSA
jgi:uncharacterized membrane protein (UPF0136 family)